MGGLIGLVVILLLLWIIIGFAADLIFGLLGTIIIGGIIGWLAGNIAKGSGYGLVNNVLLGVAGGIVGSILFRLVGIASGGLLVNILVGVVGSLVLIFVGRALRQSSSA